MGPLIFVVVVLAAIAAVWAIAGAGEAYRQIGRGGLSLRDGSDRRLEEPSGAVASAELEAEVRQLVLARNARRRARGLDPLDVEAEVARCLRDLA